MPRLHLYKDSNLHYARARVQNRVVCYQLTTRGAQELIEAGVDAEGRFAQALLLKLIRSGDAYTGGMVKAAETGEPDQMLMDLKEADLAEHLPKCEETGSALELHLVVADTDDGTTTARILNPEVRHTVRKSTVLSIPLSLIDFKALAKLREQGLLPESSVAHRTLKRWLEGDVAEKWERTARAGKPVQPSFGGDWTSGFQGKLF